jgi:hypothetical protein
VAALQLPTVQACLARQETETKLVCPLLEREKQTDPLFVVGDDVLDDVEHKPRLAHRGAGGK